MTRRIGQLIVAVVAYCCMRLAHWDRTNHPITSPHAIWEEVLGNTIMQGTLAFLAVLTASLGWIGYPKMHRNTGVFVHPLGPALAFVLLGVTPFLLFNHESALITVGIYCGAAVMAATAGWDVWQAYYVDSSIRALPAFFVVVASETIVLGINWFIIAFE